MESLYSDYSKATKLHCNGDYLEAVTEWSKLAQKQKKNPNIIFMLGIDCMKLGYYEYALTCFEQALKLKPNEKSILEAREDAFNAMKKKAAPEKSENKNSDSNQRAIAA